ncbi:MAG TPA: helix-turn-helix domain-containing protein [Pyrinomonadaceae bacterium]|jgi:DNA-binding NtrC family response regulator|nr:helix-turn-helix domain-containing protein [Pyrinomonadaceae bacterium]
MSRNAIALKPSVSKKPVQRLHSVTSTVEDQNRTEVPQVGKRVRGLKDLIYALLKEVQGLEHDELLSELTTPQEVHRLDIERGIRFDDVVRQFETNIIKQALVVTGGNQARAARLLGIKANTLNYKIKLYNI